MPKLTNNFFYPLFILGTFIITLLLIPRPQYKKFLIYGVMTGAIGNILITVLLAKVLKVVSYSNAGIFDVFGLNYLLPFAWALVHMLYLYFLPVRRLFLYPFIGFFTLLSEGYGVVIHNLGLLNYHPAFYYYVAPFIFAAWWGASAWFYRKMEGINQETKV